MQKITVCGLAYKHDDGELKVFLARRSMNKKFLPGKFELIGGHVELSDKTLEEALKREIMEEIGAEVLVEKIAGEFLYFNPEKGSQSIEVLYFMKFLDESQIKLNPEDHSEYVWASENDLENIYDDKNDNEYTLIKKVIRYLK